MIKILKTQKGISLISLAATILVMLIIVGVIVSNVNNGLEAKKINSLYNDIELLQDRVNIYYSKYGKIPVKGEQLTSINIPNAVLDSNDNDVYYEIDVQAMPNITLNYGTKKVDKDIYIINEQSHIVYYLDGIETKEGMIYKLNR